MRKLRHVINKPFQHAFCVLEWSKLKMYTFYALLKDAFKDKVRMLYTDTDSFYLHIIVVFVGARVSVNSDFGLDERVAARSAISYGRIARWPVIIRVAVVY